MVLQGGCFYERGTSVSGLGAGEGTTEGPSWGHSKVVLGAIRSFVEPFCGRLSPKIDKVSKKNDFEIPSRRALGGPIKLFDLSPDLTPSAFPFSISSNTNAWFRVEG